MQDDPAGAPLILGVVMNSCKECRALYDLLSGEPLCGEHADEMLQELEHEKAEVRRLQSVIEELEAKYEHHQEVCHAEMQDGVVVVHGGEE